MGKIFLRIVPCSTLSYGFLWVSYGVGGLLVSPAEDTVPVYLVFLASIDPGVAWPRFPMICRRSSFSIVMMHRLHRFISNRMSCSGMMLGFLST